MELTATAIKQQKSLSFQRYVYLYMNILPVYKQKIGGLFSQHFSMMNKNICGSG